MKKAFILLLTISAVLMYACRHTPPEAIPVQPGGGGNGGTNGGGGTGSDVVCFESQVLPVFQSNCAKSGCHDAASHQKGYVLDSYDNLFKKEGKAEDKNIRLYNPENSELYEVLFETGTKKMPPPPNPELTTVQKNLIARWINEGAKNTANCNISCDSSQFLFSADILPVLQNHCTGCHSGPNPPNGVDLTTYASVRPVATSGLLYGVVAHLPGFVPMPKGTGMLSDCEISQIREWVNAGALDN